MISPIFFDSHGGAWMVCTADHDGAVAFGPQFLARRLSFRWSDVDRRDIVKGEDGWDYLSPGLARMLAFNIV